MKYLFLITAICLFKPSNAQTWDLPGPNAHLQTVPANSYVIAMDNTLQTNAAGEFNLKAYGLVIHLLNNNVKIKWAIRAGKIKDAIDFTGLARQVKPNLIASVVSRNFKAGPFLIFASDLTGVDALINAYYTANGLGGANRPKVYQLTAAVNNVDIRYDLSTFKPKAGILTDGGNAAIHTAYMVAAGVPAANYTTSTGPNLSAQCFTFASEPHNSNTGAVVDATISAIKSFVLNGGNFLAQCDAVGNYENNPLGRFQTTGGLTVTNALVGTNCSFPNADLAFSQFEGQYDASLGGSIKNWQIIGSPSYGAHSHATGIGGFVNNIGASVSKISNHVYGSLVFYIGNHSFASTGITNINGIRMYMNAFLTPPFGNCPSMPLWVLEVNLSNLKLTSFPYYTEIKCTIDNNEMVDKLVIQKSKDGINFYEAENMMVSNKNGRVEYTFKDHNDYQGLFYRIKFQEKNGEIHFTQVLTSRKVLNTGEKLVVSYPILDQLTIHYQSLSADKISLRIYNQIGALLLSSEKSCIQGLNTILLNTASLPRNSFYILEVRQKDQKTNLKFLK